MDDNLPLHIKKFNNKVRAMNQARSTTLTLTAEEAQSLHAEIYDLMATISNLSKTYTNIDTNTSVVMSGGSFK